MRLARPIVGLLLLVQMLGACAGPANPPQVGDNVPAQSPHSTPSEHKAPPEVTKAPDPVPPGMTPEKDPAPTPEPAKPESTKPGSTKPEPTPQEGHVVVAKGEKQQVLNHPDGYAIELPKGLSLDFSMSSAFVRASGDGLDIKISRERSPYDDLEMYFADYLNRFISNPTYRESNNIELHEDEWLTIAGRRTRLISFTRRPAAGSTEKQNSYVFAYMITEGREFYNFFFRTESLAKHRATIGQVLESFQKIPARGKVADQLGFRPQLPKWNAETAAFYERLVAGREITWGFFYPWALTGDYSPVAKVEKKLDFHFPILLHYTYLGYPFPLEGMRQAHKRGQVVELTMQVAEGNNDNEPRANANFKVLDGQMDGAIREFARAAREFGHPFLFRLNNEMNTDWSQYSGVLTLSDPDIYIKVWRRIFDIFQEEKVENAIWIFNPNDRSYPPTNWNSHISYYPGNQYVQVLGITGYNTGTYFRDVTGEGWRSFAEIYSEIAAHYRPIYHRFPWMITEFASSSVGGDKAQWIRDMFKHLPDYPEIKAAVWWSYADFDYREGKKGTPGRRYWLDETEEYLEAFKQGLQGK